MILATLCYVRKNNQTLMLHRIKKENDIHEGKWNGLGGKIEPGESPEECIIREVKEESGLLIHSLQFKGILTFPKLDEHDWYVFVYVSDDFSGELIESAEGRLAWIDNEKITSLPQWEGDALFIPLLDKPGTFSGKFIYSREKCNGNRPLLKNDLVRYKPSDS